MRALLVPLLAFLLLAPQTGQSQEASFRIRVLLASKQGKWVDPQIPDKLRSYLVKSFGMRYSSFKLLDEKVLKVPPKEKGEMTLPDKSILKLQYREMEGEFIKLTMEVKDLKTTIRIRDGGLFFQAGYGYQNGMLVLAISASTSGKDEEKAARPRRNPEAKDSDTSEPDTKSPYERRPTSP